MPTMLELAKEGIYWMRRPCWIDAIIDIDLKVNGELPEKAPLYLKDGSNDLCFTGPFIEYNDFEKVDVSLVKEYQNGKSK